VQPEQPAQGARAARAARRERAVAGRRVGPARRTAAPAAWPARSVERREPERRAVREEVPGAPARLVAPALTSARQ